MRKEKKIQNNSLSLLLKFKIFMEINIDIHVLRNFSFEKNVDVVFGRKMTTKKEEEEEKEEEKAWKRVRKKYKRSQR